MEVLDIIDCLTRMGNTEGTGLVETPENPNEISDWVKTWFGGDCDEIRYDSLKPNTKYVYSYDTHLFGRKGIFKENSEVVVETTCAENNDNVYTNRDVIYLYEVEL